MKKIFRYSLAIMGAVVLFASCNKEEIDSPAEPEQQLPQDQPQETPDSLRTLKVVSEFGNASKVSFADGTGFAWETLDLTNMAIISTAEISNGQPESKYNATNYVSSAGEIEGEKATFTFSVDKTHIKGCCFYPNVQCGWYEINYNFPSAYTQAAAGATSNLMLLSDEIDLTAGSESVQTKFNIAGHLLRFFIYHSDGLEDQVKSVTLKAGAVISASNYKVRPDGAESAEGTTSTNVTVTLTEAYDLAGITSAENAKTVFMPIVSATSEGYTYVVTMADGDVYEFESSASKTWAEGGITEVKLNLANATAYVPAGTMTKKELVFEFTNKGVSAIARDFDHSGGSWNTTWFIVMVDGAELTDYSATYYNDFRYEVIDVDGNVVDWASAARTGNNDITVTCSANELEEARTAYVNVYFDDTEEYKVVGTYKTLDKAYTAITCAEPIVTFTVNQAAKPAAPDEPQVLDFHFADKNATNTIPLELAVPIGGVHCTMIQRPTVYVDGVEQANPFQNEFTFKVTDEDGNEVTDQSVIRPYAYSTSDMNIQVGTNAGEERTFYVNIYFSNFDAETYRVNSTVKSATETVTATHFQGGLQGKYAVAGTTEVTAINDPQTEPVYTVKIVQAGTAPTDGPAEIVYMFTNGKGVGTVSYSAGASAGSWNPGWYAVAVGGASGPQTADGNLPYFKNLRYVAVDADGNEITWLRGAQNNGKNESLISWDANDTGAERVGYVSLYLDPTDAYKAVGTYKNGGNYEELEPTDAVITFTVTQAAQ